MQKEPHIYIMPEAFLLDADVPARWRILAVINGFHFNNKDVYASNKWFSEKLKCSVRTITNGISELEKLKEVVCLRTRRTRIIKRKIEIATSFHLREKPVSISDSNQLPTNSISNSESKLANAKKIKNKKNMAIKGYNENESPDDENVIDADSGLPRGARAGSVSASERYMEMIQWAEKRGHKFIRPLTKQFRAFKIAKDNGLKPPDLKKRWEEMEDEEFWREKGFDWMDVVYSFNRRAK